MKNFLPQDYKKSYYTWLLTFLVLVIIMIALSVMSQDTIIENSGAIYAVIVSCLFIGMFIWAYLVLFQKNKRRPRGYIHVYGFIGYVLIVASSVLLATKAHN